MSTIDDIKKTYRRVSRKKILFLVVLTVLLFILSIVAIGSGRIQIPFFEVLRILFQPGTSVNDIVVLHIRLPRVLGALLVGGALGVSGAVMQCILKNSMASPFTLGTSNAAAFGAAFGIIMLGAGDIIGQTTAVWLVKNPYTVSISAFSWAMVATIVMIVLAKVLKASPESVILAGIALNAIFSAALAAMQYFSWERAFTSIAMWMFGDLGKLNHEQNFWIFIWLLPAVVYFIYKRWDFNAMEAGEDIAKGLGVNTSRTRIITMILATFITAMAISFVGIIGFIGLLAPHVIRRLVGNDHRYLIHGSLVFGALVLLLSDTLGRTMLAYTIPVGIITSFLGGPLFLYILIRRSRHAS